MGRGSFGKAYPLFGFSFDDYDARVAEKLDLLLKLREDNQVTWRGKFRPALNAAEVYPRRHQDKLPIWLGVAGTPQSFMRVGTLGLPLMIAIICGTFDRFRPLVDLYLEADHSPYMLKVGTVFDDTKMSTALLDCLPTASTYSKLATTASASRPAQLRHPLQRKRRRQHTT